MATEITTEEETFSEPLDSQAYNSLKARLMQESVSADSEEKSEDEDTEQIIRNTLGELTGF